MIKSCMKHKTFSLSARQCDCVVVFGGGADSFSFCLNNAHTFLRFIF